MEESSPSTVIQKLLAQNETLKVRVSELKGKSNALRQGNSGSSVLMEGCVSKRAAARQREAAANAEISRLKLELAILRLGVVVEDDS